MSDGQTYWPASSGRNGPTGGLHNGEVTKMYVLGTDLVIRRLYRTLRRSLDRETVNLMVAGVIMMMTWGGKQSPAGGLYAPVTSEDGVHLEQVYGWTNGPRTGGVGPAREADGP